MNFAAGCDTIDRSCTYRIVGWQVENCYFQPIHLTPLFDIVSSCQIYSVKKQLSMPMQDLDWIGPANVYHGLDEVNLRAASPLP